MSVKNLEALGRTYHGGAPPFKGAMLDDRYSAEPVEDPRDWPKDRAPFDGGTLNNRCSVEALREAVDGLAESMAQLAAGFHQPRANWLVMAPELVRLFRKALAYDEIRRKPGRSKLAAPGTRRKRNGGHRTGRRRP